MRPFVFLPAAAALMAGAVQAQQDQRPRPPRIDVERDVVIDRDGGRMVTVRVGNAGDSTRAWLGVATSASGRRDTLGLLVEEVVSGGPAAKAGLQEGDRLVSINGTSLRLAAADAEDPGMSGVVQRRLTRTLGELKPGAEVELGVYSDGRPKTLKVKTIAASEAPARQAMGRTMRPAAPRAVLGVSPGGSPSKRDTAGVFLAGVTADGPAEKAGIVEGERIAAINGQDLRVAREDAGDAAAARAKSAKLERALGEAKPGDEVELRVVTAGRSRTVKVKTVEARELAARAGEDFEVFVGGPMGAPMDGRGRLRMGMPRPPMPPMPPMAPDAPNAPEMHWFNGGPEGDVRIRINGEEIEPRAFLRERMPQIMRQFRFEGGAPGRVEVRRERRITI